MTEQARVYGAVLFELAVPEKAVSEAVSVFEENPKLLEALTSPVVPAEKKRRVIGQVFGRPEFPPVLVRFLKKACDAGCIGEIGSIAGVRRELAERAEGVVKARLEYVTMPDEAQIAGIREFLCRRYGGGRADLEFVHQPELIGGFVLKTGDTEYDYSLRGRLRRLSEAVTG